MPVQDSQALKRENYRIEADLKKKEKDEADLRNMIKELQNQK